MFTPPADDKGAHSSGETSDSLDGNDGACFNRDSEGKDKTPPDLLAGNDGARFNRDSEGKDKTSPDSLAGDNGAHFNRDSEGKDKTPPDSLAGDDGAHFNRVSEGKDKTPPDDDDGAHFNRDSEGNDKTSPDPEQQLPEDPAKSDGRRGERSPRLRTGDTGRGEGTLPKAPPPDGSDREHTGDAGSGDNTFSTSPNITNIPRSFLTVSSCCGERDEAGASGARGDSMGNESRCELTGE